MYSRWENACNEIVTNKITNWKIQPNIKYMLEHVLPYQAVEYIKLSKLHLSQEEIQSLASLNDMYGGTQVINIDNIITSPSSARYISHAVDIINHISAKNLDNITIVEVGGGYGGLALVLLKLAEMKNINIQKYIIYDLPFVKQLQQYYLNSHDITKVEWKDSSTFGEDLEDGNNFLISCYCISEIEKQYRQQYLKKLLPKCKGAFFAWNNTDKDDLPENRDERPEVPQTGTINTIIRI